jgi:LAGLIDADG endonuclease
VGGENSTGEWLRATPDNQQERLNDYLSGYVDGEGSFHVAVQRNPSAKFGWQLVPEFHVSQNPERASILELLRVQLGCGRVRPNAGRGKRDKSLVFVVRKRDDLLMKVIPFFEHHPILSEKRLEFETFALIVRAMDRREHLTQEGFKRLLQLAVRMNGGGRYRRIDWSSRILRGYTPNTEPGFREDIVRPPWRHGEPGGTETTWPLDPYEQLKLMIER